MRSSLFLKGALALAVFAMASCGGGSASAPSSTTPATTTTVPAVVTVSIVSSVGNQAFNPNPVMVSTGGTVNFTNNDSVTHHIVLDDGSADLGEVAPGKTETTVLKGTGGNFHCVIHSTMVGSINGSSAPTAPAPPCDAYGYGC